MAARSRGGAPAEEEPPAGGLPHSPKELVVLAQPALGLRAEGPRMASITGADRDIAKLGELLSRAGAMIRPLFGLSEDRLLARMRTLAPKGAGTPADLSLYYHVDAPEPQLETLAEELRKQAGVEGAYVKPEAEPPVAVPEVIRSLNDMAPQAEAPPATPDFIARQVYLNTAPEGIDALYAWTLAGGRGTGVRVIDCEWGWNFTHEDLLQNQSGVVVGVSSADDNHGTAVLGEISGDRNMFGVTGIAPEAIVGAASFVNKPSAQTIREAADKLSAGDIILLEIHRAGPNATGEGQFGYIAIEWWPDDFAAIRYAINKGIVVVEAAGNGHQNLDDAVYGVRPAGFPASWTNPFNPANPSSGAIVVGAGNPPSGIHGRTQHPTWGEVYVDRARCVFSNHGQRVDCQGWGWEVTSTGYGDIQGGNRNVWYTDQFSGTSSASPIIVGALACVQGIIKAQGGTLLTSPGAIQLLRASGSPQQSAPNRPVTQRIGNRPNLRQLVPSTTDIWHNDKLVVATHAKTGSQQAWAILGDMGPLVWRQIRPKAPDGVTQVLLILSEALANNRRVDVYIRDGGIEEATLR